jgi:hypothetical protein
MLKALTSKGTIWVRDQEAIKNLEKIGKAWINIPVTPGHGGGERPMPGPGGKTIHIPGTPWTGELPGPGGKGIILPGGGGGGGPSPIPTTDRILEQIAVLIEKFQDHVGKWTARIIDKMADFRKAVCDLLRGQLRELAMIETAIKGGGGGKKFPPEPITPSPGLFVRTIPGPGPSPIYVSANFNVTAIDSKGVRDFIRKQGGPELVKYVETNLGKRTLQKALGVG